MAYGHVYDHGFYDYIAEGSRRSAGRVARELSAELALKSVLDVGCGQGIWAAAFRDIAGVREVAGVDGDYVERHKLAIPADCFFARDLSQPFDLGRRFDLAISLEVAEHLPPKSSERFVASLVRHSDLVLFSAAVPGQGGEHHINERPLAFWRTLFARHGYAAYDFLRRRLRGAREVKPWYRYNTLLYAGPATGILSPALRESRLANEAGIPEFSSLPWRLRCALLRPLPRPLVERAAGAKHAIVRARQRMSF